MKARNKIKQSGEINHDRRRFLRNAAMTLAAANFAAIGSARGQFVDAEAANAPAFKNASRRSFDSTKQIDAGALSVGYAEVGRPDGPVVILLHGWPYDIHSYLEVAPLLASAGYRVIVPFLRGFGSTRFLLEATVRNAQQSAVAQDIIALMDALNIRRAVIGGFDWGARTACIMAALWPARCKAIVSVSGYLISNPKTNEQPLAPGAEIGWWYQYYFATERGKLGYGRNLFEFNKLIWRNASPHWKFDDATYKRTAAAFDNPDHVDIVIHNYRWRLGLAKGEAKYDDLESKLSGNPPITVPAITLASDFDGAAADGKAYADKFWGKHRHRILRNIGHNVPQEAPDAFTECVVDVDGF